MSPVNTNDWPPTTVRVIQDPHYLAKHVMGSLAVGLSGSLSVLLALGRLPQTQPEWLGLLAPLIASLIKVLQSWGGSQAAA